MNPALKIFFFPTALSLLLLLGVFLWLGPGAFVITLLLVILEVTLSFDNAVVNAKILAQMSDIWRKRFLTWGILVAVFGTRFVLPIFIVAASVALSPVVVTKLALFDPEAYGRLLEGAHYAIAAFGGSFLLMVALKYFFDDAKDVHWIRTIERHISRWGRIEAIEIGIALVTLLIISSLVPEAGGTVLAAGLIGIVLFIAMQGIANSFSVEAQAVAGAGSVALFLYLNVLDAAFSLDGVVGAFAITNELVIIIIGLGIGAYFVRTMTVYLVEQKTLDSLTYLEHGAHWAIFGLAAAMLVSLFYHVPEVIIGLVGLVFVGASYWSSLKLKKAQSS
jgi:uncharacterized protein